MTLNFSGGYYSLQSLALLSCLFLAVLVAGDGQAILGYGALELPFGCCGRHLLFQLKLSMTLHALKSHTLRILLRLLLGMELSSDHYSIEYSQQSYFWLLASLDALHHYQSIESYWWRNSAYALEDALQHSLVVACILLEFVGLVLLVMLKSHSVLVAWHYQELSHSVINCRLWIGFALSFYLASVMICLLESIDDSLSLHIVSVNAHVVNIVVVIVMGD